MQSRHELDVLLDRDGDHTAEDVRTPRAGEREQVREAFDADAEVRARTVGPLVGERAPVATAHVEVEERTGHRVEPGGEHDDVDVVLRIRRADPGGRDLLDRRRVHVDELSRCRGCT